jgi:nucleoid-associated protein YgaU
LPPSGPPPFMSEPPKSSPLSQHDAGSLEPPFKREPGEPGRFRQAAGDVHLIPPAEETRQPAGRAELTPPVAGRKASFDQGGDGFASAGDPPPAPREGRHHRDDTGRTAASGNPPPPPSRENNRYGQSRTLPPPPPESDYGRPSGSGRGEGATTGRGFVSEEEPVRHHRPRSYGSPPPLRDDGKYEVQPNDSYWTISERVYGIGAYFKALAEHNRDKSDGEDRLKPGTLISAPPIGQLEKSYPDLCPKPSRRETLQNRASIVKTGGQYRSGRTYTVAEGDTLFIIAKYELGKASRWAEIYELNRDLLGKDYNYLTPGMQLTLPEKERSEITAEPPRTGYRR